jgi:hypothetical protein
LNCLPDELKRWIELEPTVKDLISVATGMRLAQPEIPASVLLESVGRDYPRAYQFLNDQECLMDAWVIIKLVNHYDRPAFVYRLYQTGLLDVYSASDEWEKYGVKSYPTVNAIDLPQTYQSYPAHLNVPNPLRDASANEKLFEIAACERVSINLHSLELSKFYPENSILSVNRLTDLDKISKKVLNDPQPYLRMGKEARVWTARHHTWEHRLQKILN